MRPVPATDTSHAAMPAPGASVPDDVASPYAAEDAVVVRRDLVATAGRLRPLATMHRAFRAAGLSHMLRGEGPFTVFAPTERAFASLSDAERDRLFTDRALLASVVSMHVVRGKVRAPHVNAPRTATSLQGQELELTRVDGKYRVNGARITKTGIKAGNGVIHAIDTVLMPR